MILFSITLKKSLLDMSINNIPEEDQGKNSIKKEFSKLLNENIKAK